MISVLCPSRGRPQVFRAMMESLAAATANPYGVEVVAYIDEDDRTRWEYPPAHEYLRYVRGPRVMFSDLWNKCFDACRGDIVMHAGDDQLFRTQGWDAMVERAYLDCPDKVLMVHGSDEGQHFHLFGAILCLSRKWCETVGYVTPPWFVGDCPDKWLNEVANALGRRKYLPFVTEHMHPLFGKGPDDLTHQERREREKAADPYVLYDTPEMCERRAADIEKLRAVMDESWRVE